MQMAENELYRRMGNYELEEVAAMNKDYQEELNKAKEPKKYYALLHKCNGEYYWVQCNDSCSSDIQVPFKQKWVEKEDEFDTIKGIVSSNKEVISLLTWLNIKPSFIKEITLDLKKLVRSVDK